MQTKNNNYRTSSDFDPAKAEDWLAVILVMITVIILVYTADWTCRSWLGFSLTAFLPGGVASPSIPE